MSPFFGGQGNDTHRSTVAPAGGGDGTRPFINIVSSTVAPAGGRDGTRPYVWHSVFGLCSSSQIESCLQLRHESIKHKRHVNGLIKLERKMWICDKADRLDEAFQRGDMQAMYMQLGALTKFAKSNTSAAKVCRVSNADGVPTQSCSESKLAFRAHFQRLCLPRPSLISGKS